MPYKTQVDFSLPSGENTQTLPGVPALASFRFLWNGGDLLGEPLMKLPVICGTIDRRILANYRVDAEVMRGILPPPFRPKLINGFALGGICLIRLKAIRPRFFPFPWGLGSENSAHRIAVEWEANGKSQQGVYIPRRDTSSRLNTLVGGRIFPGEHHFAKFAVQETSEHLSVSLDSADGQTHVAVSGTVSSDFPTSSTFGSLAAASDFFQQGSLGYSVTSNPGKYDGLELRCSNWQMESLKIDKIESSFFEDKSRFPKGSVTFDCALLMRHIRHEWHGREDICCTAPSGAT